MRLAVERARYVLCSVNALHSLAVLLPSIQRRSTTRTGILHILVASLLIQHRRSVYAIIHTCIDMRRVCFWSLHKILHRTPAHAWRDDCIICMYACMRTLVEVLGQPCLLRRFDWVCFVCVCILIAAQSLAHCRRYMHVYNIWSRTQYHCMHVLRFTCMGDCLPACLPVWV